MTDPRFPLLARFRHRRRLLVAGGLLLDLAIAVPALAHPTTLPDGASIRYDAKSDRYCVSQRITGSMLPIVTCESQADWAKDGVVISRR